MTARTRFISLTGIFQISTDPRRPGPRQAQIRPLPHSTVNKGSGIQYGQRPLTLPLRSGVRLNPSHWPRFGEVPSD